MSAAVAATPKLPINIGVIPITSDEFDPEPNDIDDPPDHAVDEEAKESEKKELSMVYNPKDNSVFSTSKPREDGEEEEEEMGDEELSDDVDTPTIISALNKVTTNIITLELSLRAFDLSTHIDQLKTDLPTIDVEDTGKKNKKGDVILDATNKTPGKLKEITELYEYVRSIPGATLSCIRMLMKDFHPILGERYAIQLLKTINDQFESLDIPRIISIAQFISILATCQVLYTDQNPTSTIVDDLTRLIKEQNNSPPNFTEGAKVKTFFYLYNSKKKINFIVYISDWDYSKKDTNKKNKVSKRNIVARTLFYNIRDADNIKSNSVRELCNLLPTTWNNKPKNTQSGLNGKLYTFADLYEGFPVNMPTKNIQMPLPNNFSIIQNPPMEIFNGTNQEHILAILVASVGLTSYFIQTIINLVMISSKSNSHVNGDPWETPAGKYAYLQHYQNTISITDNNLEKRKQIVYTKLDMINQNCLNPVTDKQIIDDRVDQLISCKKVFQDFQRAAVLGIKPTLYSYSQYKLLLLSRQEIRDLKTINDTLTKHKQKLDDEIKHLRSVNEDLGDGLITYCKNLIRRIHTVLIQTIYTKELILSVIDDKPINFDISILNRLPESKKKMFFIIYSSTKRIRNFDQSTYRFDITEYDETFKNAFITSCMTAIECISIENFFSEIHELIDLLQRIVCSQKFEEDGTTYEKPNFDDCNIPETLDLNNKPLQYYLDMINELSSCITILDEIKPSFQLPLPTRSIILPSNPDTTLDDNINEKIESLRRREIPMKVVDKLLERGRAMKKLIIGVEQQEFNSRRLILTQLAHDAQHYVSQPGKSRATFSAAEQQKMGDLPRQKYKLGPSLFSAVFREEQERDAAEVVKFAERPITLSGVKPSDTPGSTLVPYALEFNEKRAHYNTVRLSHLRQTQKDADIQWFDDEKLNMDLIHEYVWLFDSMNTQIDNIIYSQDDARFFNIDLLFDLCSDKFIECIISPDINYLTSFIHYILYVRIILQNVSYTYSFASEINKQLDENFLVYLTLFNKYIHQDYQQLHVETSTISHMITIINDYKINMSTNIKPIGTESRTIQEKIRYKLGLTPVPRARRGGGGAAEGGGKKVLNTQMRGGELITDLEVEIDILIKNKNNDKLFEIYMTHFGKYEDEKSNICINKIFRYLNSQKIHVPPVRSEDELNLSDILQNVENQRCNFANTYDFDNYAANGLCVHIFGTTLFKLNNELMKGRLVLPVIYPYISANVFDKHTFIIIYNVIKCLCLQFSNCILLQFYFMSLNTFIGEPYSNLFVPFDELNIKLEEKMNAPDNIKFAKLTIKSPNEENIYTKSPITNTIKSLDSSNKQNTKISMINTMKYDTPTEITNISSLPPAPPPKYNQEIRAGKRTYRKNRNANAKKTKRRKTIKRNTRRFKVN